MTVALVMTTLGLFPIGQVSQLPFGDLTGDHQVDLKDLAHFWNGLQAGTGSPPVSEIQFNPADLDADGDVDLDDFRELVRLIIGPQDERTCGDNSDCGDGDFTSFDICVNGLCEHYPIPSFCHNDFDCLDFDPCTIACVPLIGICMSEPIRWCCWLQSQCDDHTPCTVDSCDDLGMCRFEHIPDCCGDESDCDDSVGCTRDECRDGACVYTPDDKVCNPGATGDGIDPDADCLWNVCDPGSAEESASGCAPIGYEKYRSPCDDTIECTSEDYCAVFVQGDPPRCISQEFNHLLCNTAPADNDPDADCGWNFCTSLGCHYADLQEREGSPCDDGLDCTRNDICTSFFCYGKGFHCAGTVEASMCADQDDCDANCTKGYCDTGYCGGPGRGCVVGSEPPGSPCLRGCPPSAPYSACGRYSGECECSSTPPNPCP